MKFGVRTPSLKRSLSARTTGKWKRQVRRALIPGYGVRGMGFVKHPRRSVRNAVYRRTTVSLWDLFR